MRVIIGRSLTNRAAQWKRCWVFMCGVLGLRDKDWLKRQLDEAPSLAPGAVGAQVDQGGGNRARHLLA